MSRDEEFDRYLPDDHANKDPLFVEIPSEPKPLEPERIPSGYDPMGRIYLQGRAYRGLAGGRIPWWVLISGWFMFGGYALVILFSAISSASFSALPALIFVLLPLLIMWRGTIAKLAAQKRRRR